MLYLFIANKIHLFTIQVFFICSVFPSLTNNIFFLIMSEVLDMILKDYAFLEMILSISLSCYKMKTSFHVRHLNQVYTFIVCCACRSVLRDRVVLFLYGKWVVIATFINKIVEYQVMEKTCSFMFFIIFFSEHCCVSITN